MSRILITGSSDGLGSLTARLLVSRGHDVVLHARNPQRARDAESACPGAKATITGDLSTLSGIREVASQANALGPFDSILHNAGLYVGPFRRTEDGLPALFAVNTVAPYVLSCLIERPKRLVFVSSGLHRGGDAGLRDISWRDRGEQSWDSMQAYGDSKLQDILLAFAFARRSGVYTAAVDPGWVPTKMGGQGAPDDLGKAVECFAMVTAGDGDASDASGKYWYQSKVTKHKSEAADIETQDKLLRLLEDISGVKAP